MNQTIYNSNNSRGLLKSMGPYKIISTDKSISGVILPKTNEIKPVISGKPHFSSKPEIYG